MSTHSTDAIHISRRYATAIFALSVEAKNEQTVVEEFSVLARAIEGSPELAEALASPMVAHGQKVQVLAALIAKANTVTKRAVEEVAEAGRSALIPSIAAQLREELSRRQGELEATITSARPARCHPETAGAIPHQSHRQNGETEIKRRRERPWRSAYRAGLVASGCHAQRGFE